jgi:ATP-dependent helicase/nuclease subunit B
MAATLHTAPLGSGATTYLLSRALDAARTQLGRVYVLTASIEQSNAWRARLAQAGGALGIRIMTFREACVATVNAAGQPTAYLDQAAELRFMTEAIARTRLDHYASVRTFPGFAQAMQHVVFELQAAEIGPVAFSGAVSEPRLTELGGVYTTYARLLAQGGWQDAGALARMALDALDAAPALLTDWRLLLVDGFDSFTQVVIAWLTRAAARVADCEIVTPDPGQARLPRFELGRARLEHALGLAARPLSATYDTPLAALRRHVADGDSGQKLANIELVAAPDREGEVRAALRWLKQRHVQDGVPLDRMALLSRKSSPYRPAVAQIASEMGIPVALADGEALDANPAVAALLSLLDALTPEANEGALLPRVVLDAWRSPYFDWSAQGITPGLALALDVVARNGNVVSGLSQWREAFAFAAAAGADPDADDAAPIIEDSVLQALQTAFDAFLACCLPPDGVRNLTAWCAWLEDLIGPDPLDDWSKTTQEVIDRGLDVFACVDRVPALAARDRAALRQFNAVLQGMLWTDAALIGLGRESRRPERSFIEFLTELRSTVAVATYAFEPAGNCIWVADVLQARGLSFDVVAVLGMAEGEFPASLSEDAFLRDDDRLKLADALGVRLTLSTEGAEREFFYVACTRATRRALFTRPRIADNGAPWQASPFWDELGRIAASPPRVIGSNDLPAPDEAASLVELQTLAACGAGPTLTAWLTEQTSEAQAIVARGAVLAGSRYDGGFTPFDGDLTGLAAVLAQTYGSGHVWSASQIETYHDCAHRFFVERVLRLAPRIETNIGPDTAQLGTLYHELFERAYSAAADSADLQSVLIALDHIAPDVFAQATGFRATAWWPRVQAQILADVRMSMTLLATDGWMPRYFEQRFNTQAVTHEGQSVRVRGMIDRIDVNADGNLRVIDYKLGGPSAFTAKALADGKKLQLPLYALAARDELRLGQPVDGFYMHYTKGEISPLTLGDYEGGVAGAIRTASAHILDAVEHIRSGHFPPLPPTGGCPSYCPAAAYCWRYSPRAF